MKKTCLIVWLVAALSSSVAAQDRLPSWNDGPAKTAILEFVAAVTREDGPDYVPPAERIAVFDNDGTLWVESPLPAQLQFTLDRVKALAPAHPEWRTQQPYQAVLEGDRMALLATGLAGLRTLVMATHAGMTTDEFGDVASDWLSTAKHPVFERRYTELVYQPMLEVLAYLRAHGFKTFIVSGGGVEFLRQFAEDVYGVPPEQVVGSSVVTRFEMRDGTPVLVREPKLFFMDNKEGKPVAIHRIIGRRPIAAFGNADGDLQMLQWSAARGGRHLCMIVNHDDGERETDYAHGTALQGVDKILAEAGRAGWSVVSMRNDWAVVLRD